MRFHQILLLFADRCFVELKEFKEMRLYKLVELYLQSVRTSSTEILTFENCKKTNKFALLRNFSEKILPTKYEI